jgi:hypothetical protein
MHINNINSLNLKIRKLLLLLSVFSILYKNVQRQLLLSSLDELLVLLEQADLKITQLEMELSALLKVVDAKSQAQLSATYLPLPLELVGWFFCAIVVLVVFAKTETGADLFEKVLSTTFVKYFQTKGTRYSFRDDTSLLDWVVYINEHCRIELFVKTFSATDYMPAAHYLLLLHKKYLQAINPAYPNCTTRELINSIIDIASRLDIFNL